MSASLFSWCSGKFLADDIAQSFTQEIVDWDLQLWRQFNSHFINI